VEKYGGARQTTDDNITLRMHFACQVTKARIQTHTYTTQELLLFHCNNGYAKASGLLHTYVSCLVRFSLSARKSPVLMFYFSQFNPCFKLKELVGLWKNTEICLSQSA
jgi:hypothetical protein